MSQEQKSGNHLIRIVAVGLLKLPFTIVADVVTLGGTVNDGYFRNGRRSYTSKALVDTLNKAIR